MKDVQYLIIYHGPNDARNIEVYAEKLADGIDYQENLTFLYALYNSTIISEKTINFIGYCFFFILLSYFRPANDTFT